MQISHFPLEIVKTIATHATFLNLGRLALTTRGMVKYGRQDLDKRIQNFSHEFDKFFPIMMGSCCSLRQLDGSILLHPKIVAGKGEKEYSTFLVEWFLQQNDPISESTEVGRILNGEEWENYQRSLAKFPEIVRIFLTAINLSRQSTGLVFEKLASESRSLRAVKTFQRTFDFCIKNILTFPQFFKGEKGFFRRIGKDYSVNNLSPRQLQDLALKYATDVVLSVDTNILIAIIKGCTPYGRTLYKDAIKRETSENTNFLKVILYFQWGRELFIRQYLLLEDRKERFLKFDLLECTDECHQKFALQVLEFTIPFVEVDLEFRDALKLYDILCKTPRVTRALNLQWVSELQNGSLLDLAKLPNSTPLMILNIRLRELILYYKENFIGVIDILPSHEIWNEDLAGTTDHIDFLLRKFNRTYINEIKLFQEIAIQSFNGDRFIKSVQEKSQHCQRAAQALDYSAEDHFIKSVQENCEAVQRAAHAKEVEATQEDSTYFEYESSNEIEDTDGSYSEGSEEDPYDLSDTD